MKEIIKLPEVVYPTGTGIDNLEARLVKREGNVCMYIRSDQVWEVFTVKIQKARKIKGKDLMAHEVYPGNEDFGNTAWCFTNLENAESRFKHMVSFASKWRKTELKAA